jgi:sugar-specific transcriptional regulator TrmB
MVKKALQKIGLTDGEIRVYLALIEVGASSTGDIIKKSGISGSKVYEVLDRLVSKGLASYIIKNNVKHFEASSPNRILDYLEEKKQDIDLEKQDILKIIPNLILKQKGTTKNEAKIYTGFEGAKTAYEDAIQSLKKGEEILGWGLTEQPESWEIYFDKREKFRADKGVIHKSIINEKYKSLHNTRKKFKNTHIRFFPKELEMPTTVEIWKNKVALFIITKENPITIVIESQAAADSFRKYFYVMWKTAKK